MTDEKVLYQNTTQVSNFILDNLHLFSGNEVKVILFITRKTIGWHKETDFIRYSQLMESLNISKPTLSEAVNRLVEMGLIVRTTKDGEVLKEVPQGYRGEIYYTLNKDFNREWLNNFTSTGKESLPYKTHPLQNSNSSSKEDGNSQGMKKLSAVMERIKLTQPLSPTDKVDKRLGNGWQYYALEVVKIAGFKNGESKRIFQVFKQKNFGHFQMEKTKEVINHANYKALKSEKDKVSYLIGAYRKSM